MTLSTAGTNNENKLAANIIPPAIPNKNGIFLSEIFRQNNSGIVPKPVADPAIKLAIKPLSAFGLFCKKSTQNVATK